MSTTASHGNASTGRMIAAYAVKAARVILPGGSISTSCFRRNFDATTGIASHATKNEMIRLDAIDNESAAKNAPKTPTRNAGGIWMTIVERDDPASGLVNSSVAPST